MKVNKYSNQDVRYITEKLDGHNVRIIVPEDKSLDPMMISRKDIDNFPKIRERHEELAYQVLDLPRGTILYGEIYAPGVHATSVPTMINEGDKRLMLSAFAVKKFAGKNYAWVNLLSAMQMMTGEGWMTPATLEVLEGGPRPLSDFEVAAWIEWAKRGDKREGVVAKFAHWEGWYKIKPTLSVDAIVIDYDKGEGKHEGRLGSLHVAVYDDGELKKIARVGTGFNDKERDAIWAERAQVTGMVVEVEYDEVNARGALKFPRFVRFRDDKPAEECTMEQLS